MICGPPIQSHVQNNIAAIVYRVDETKSGFWRRHTDVLPKPSASAFWERARHFIHLRESAHKAKTFENGWDGYDAHPPNEASVGRTLEVLARVHDSRLTPYSVLPSAD